MATKIKQKPKVTRKSAAKPKSIGSPKRGAAKALTSHTNPTTPSAKGKGKTASVHGTNMMPSIVEYPGERKGRNFGPNVKTVGSRG